MEENSSIEWESRKNLKQNSSFNQAHQTIENYISIKSTKRRIRHLFIWWVENEVRGNWVLYSVLKMSRHQIFSRGKCCGTGGYLDAAGCKGPSSLVPTFPRETAQPGGPHVTSSLCAWPDWDRADRDHAAQSVVVVFACTGRKIVVSSRFCCRYRRSVSHKTKENL